MPVSNREIFWRKFNPLIAKFYPRPSPQCLPTQLFTSLASVHVPDSRFLDLNIELSDEFTFCNYGSLLFPPTAPNPPPQTLFSISAGTFAYGPSYRAKRKMRPSSVELASVAKNKKTDLIQPGECNIGKRRENF